MGLRHCPATLIIFCPCKWPVLRHPAYLCMSLNCQQSNEYYRSYAPILVPLIKDIVATGLPAFILYLLQDIVPGIQSQFFSCTGSACYIKVTDIWLAIRYFRYYQRQQPVYFPDSFPLGQYQPPQKKNTGISLYHTQYHGLIV